jgi:hypothetical protein
MGSPFPHFVDPANGLLSIKLKPTRDSRAARRPASFSLRHPWFLPVAMRYFAGKDAKLARSRLP